MSRVETEKGYFGRFGGSFVSPELQEVLDYLAEQFEKHKDDPDFQEEYLYYLREYVGRETPLTYARNLTEHLKGAKIYLKREDLNHTGAHKINNVIGQILLAKRMGPRGSSPRPAPVNTGWPRQPPVPCSGWTAPSTWVRRIPVGRR